MNIKNYNNNHKMRIYLKIKIKIKIKMILNNNYFLNKYKIIFKKLKKKIKKFKIIIFQNKVKFKII